MSGCARSWPEVSVVVPTRNRAALLAGVLDVVLGQEEVDLELIVVDDGSTDATPEILAARRDPRVRVLRNEVNRGVARARNRGIAEARAPWVAFLDDDDLWAPRKLRAQLDAVPEGGAALVYCGALAVDEQRRVDRALPAPPDADLARDLLGGNRIGSPSCVLAGAPALRRTGGFDPRLSILADWDLWIRLVATGRPIAAPGLLVAYTEHAANMSLDMGAMLREYAFLRRKHRGLVRSLGRPDTRLWWEWIASGYRRGGHRLRAAAIYLGCAMRYRSWRSLRFAAGMLLGEERLRLGPDFPSAAPPPVPDWLARHR